MRLLSIIIPAYNEEHSIDCVISALHQVLDAENIHFEMVFIDDGSTDATWEKIKAQSGTSAVVRGYRFSRNFGKEAAIWAGLQRARGDCYAVMDCDLQHPPELLPAMYRLWEEGYEIVEGVKARRGKESPVHKFFSDMFYRIIAALSGLDMRASSDYKLLDKRVVEELLELKEQNAFFRGLSHWLGFRSTKVEYAVAPRKFGATKWSFPRLVKYALNNIAGFSTAPMQMVTVIGIVLLLGSVVLGVQTLIRFFSGHALEGFTTIILLILPIGSGLMISLGIIGLYISKIYEEVKGRPRFIVKESTFKEE